jgi:hypothetical protein
VIVPRAENVDRRAGAGIKLSLGPSRIPRAAHDASSHHVDRSGSSDVSRGTEFDILGDRSRAEHRSGTHHYSISIGPNQTGGIAAYRRMMAAAERPGRSDASKSPPLPLGESRPYPRTR